MMRNTTKILAGLALAAGLAGCVMPPAGTHSLGSSTYGSAPTAVTTVDEPLPMASNFRLQVIETKRDCFGSAGCNVQYRVIPSYGGGPTPKSSFTLLYQVVGLDDTKTGSIAVAGGKFSTETGFGQTEEGVTLTAHVTQILEN